MLATQTLWQSRPRTMLLELAASYRWDCRRKTRFSERSERWASTAGSDTRVEYAGEAIRGFSMENRMTD